MSSMNIPGYFNNDLNNAFLLRQDSFNQLRQNSFTVPPMLSPQTSFTSPTVSAGMSSEQLMQTIKILEMQRDALVASMKNPALSGSHFGGAFAPVSSVLEQQQLPANLPQKPHQSTTPNLLSMLQQQTVRAPFVAVSAVASEAKTSSIESFLMGGHNGPQSCAVGEPAGSKRKADFMEGSVSKKPSTSPSHVGEVSSLTGKAVLSAESACAIYRLRPKARGVSGTVKSHTGEIARTYGVTAKTIRDIWNRTTWAKDTKHLWTDEETQQYISQRARMSAKLDPTQNLPTWFAGAQ